MQSNLFVLLRPGKSSLFVRKRVKIKTAFLCVSLKKRQIFAFVCISLFSKTTDKDGVFRLPLWHNVPQRQGSLGIESTTSFMRQGARCCVQHQGPDKTCMARLFVRPLVVGRASPCSLAMKMGTSPERLLPYLGEASHERRR